MGQGVCVHACVWEGKPCSNNSNTNKTTLCKRHNTDIYDQGKLDQGKPDHKYLKVLN